MVSLPAGPESGKGNRSPSTNGVHAASGPRKSGQVDPSSVAEMARMKGLPEPWLQSHGLKDLPGGGIAISYLDAGGKELFTRKRGVPGSPKRFDHPPGVNLQPYGLHQLADLDSTGVLHVTEGESDCLTLWYHNIPALGLPGSSSYNTLEAEHLAGVTELWVCQDGDAAGKSFVEGLARRLDEIGYEGRAQAVHMPDGVKDVNELYCRDPERFCEELDRQKRYATDLP